MQHQIINGKSIQQHPDIAVFAIMHRPSTSVEYIGMDYGTERLFVQFHGGKSYIYEGVPETIARGCINCPSIGKYINDLIKPSYTAVKYDYKLVNVVEGGGHA